MKWSPFTRSVSQAGPPVGATMRVELVLIHDRVDALGPRQPTVLVQRLQVGRVRERPLLLRLQEQLLAEVRHLLCAVRLVEGDHVGEGLARGAFGPRPAR